MAAREEGHPLRFCVLPAHAQCIRLAPWAHPVMGDSEEVNDGQVAVLAIGVIGRDIRHKRLE